MRIPASCAGICLPETRVSANFLVISLLPSRKKHASTMRLWMTINDKKPLLSQLQPIVNWNTFLADGYLPCDSDE